MQEPAKNKVTTMPRLRGIWDLVTRIAIIPALIVSVIHIYGWLQTPSPDLRAYAVYGEMHWPESIRRFLTSVRDEVTPERVETLVRDSFLLRKLSSGEHTLTIGDIEDVIEQFLQYDPAMEDLRDLMKSGGCWHISVQNTGDKIAEDVQLHLPRTGRIEIHREGQDYIEVDEANNAALGDIRPLETVYVVAWQSSTLFRHLKPELRINDNSGFGKVDMAVPLGFPYSWICWHRSWLLGLAVVAIGFLPLMYLLFGASSTGGKSQSEEEVE